MRIDYARLAQCQHLSPKWTKRLFSLRSRIGSPYLVGGCVPGWSTEIANEFMRLAAAEGKAFSQMHLQELVYIAHGWCLALTGQPLTGDRPEALDHGPEYRRLAAALANYGTRAIPRPISISGSAKSWSKSEAVLVDTVFDPIELSIMAQVYANYAQRPTSELATLTRADDTPWDVVYARGAGKGRDISHQLIRRQFAKIANRQS